MQLHRPMEAKRLLTIVRTVEQIASVKHALQAVEDLKFISGLYPSNIQVKIRLMKTKERLTYMRQKERRLQLLNN